MSVRILHGDCRDVLSTLATGSAQCCVTSPPYFGLRDYGVDGQIGLEPTPDEYVAELVAVFRKVRRVLADDGLLWLNLGDSYCSQGGVHEGRDDNQSGVGAKRVWRAGSARADGVIDSEARRNRNGTFVPGMKAKDLIGIPWMVAFALRADGWYLRKDIIWHKPNPMPESVTDRPTSAHEHVFLLSKEARYFYDGDAIREAMAPSSIPRLAQDLDAQVGSARGNGGVKVMKAVARKSDKKRGHSRRHDGFNDRWDAMPKAAQCQTANARDVWTIATQPFSGAHFATMPPELAERCIKAGSRAGDTILDPFGGAGTTGLVADRLGRHATMIELNPEYKGLAASRVVEDCPMFAEVLA